MEKAAFEAFSISQCPLNTAISTMDRRFVSNSLEDETDLITGVLF